jgi:hypothetical protein
MWLPGRRLIAKPGRPISKSKFLFVTDEMQTWQRKATHLGKGSLTNLIPFHVATTLSSTPPPTRCSPIHDRLVSEVTFQGDEIIVRGLLFAHRYAILDRAALRRNRQVLFDIDTSRCTSAASIIVVSQKTMSWRNCLSAPTVEDGFTPGKLLS